VAGDASDALDLKHALGRNALPRMDGWMFDTECSGELCNAPSLTCRSLDDLDHG
jgi:hypothetical protein